MRNVPWFVIVSVQPCTRVLLADAELPENNIEIAKYLVWSCSAGAAVKKALNQYKKDVRNGYELRLGQGKLYSAIERTHKKEAFKWKGKTLR